MAALRPRKRTTLLRVRDREMDAGMGVKWSVIVPAYNAAGTLPACLHALLHQTIARDEYEVIVVDDGSTDGTGETVPQSEVVLIRQTHRGPAAARNGGIRVARGELLLFTDADCVPTPNWIEAMTVVRTAQHFSVN